MTLDASFYASPAPPHPTSACTSTYATLPPERISFGQTSPMTSTIPKTWRHWSTALTTWTAWGESWGVSVEDLNREAIEAAKQLLGKRPVEVPYD